MLSATASLFLAKNWRDLEFNVDSIDRIASEQWRRDLRVIQFITSGFSFTHWLGLKGAGHNHVQRLSRSLSTASYNATSSAFNLRICSWVVESVALFFLFLSLW